MTRADYLHHVSLGTGDVLRVPRASVDEAVCADLVKWLRDALGGTVPMPGQLGPMGYTAAAACESGSLVCTVFSPPLPVIGRAPLATLGIATRSRHSAVLWRKLLDVAPAAPSVAHAPAPPVPWCGIHYHSNAMIVAAGQQLDNRWIGEFARDIAWAWIMHQ